MVIDYPLFEQGEVYKLTITNPPLGQICTGRGIGAGTPGSISTYKFEGAALLVSHLDPPFQNKISIQHIEKLAC